MSIFAQASAPASALLPEAAVQESLRQGLEGRFTGARLLVLIPDHTRSLPLPMLFRQLVALLQDCRQLDFMVALGTHPPLDEASMQALLGISAAERASTYAHIGLYNHAWDDPTALSSLGTLPQAEVQAIAGALWHPSLGGDVPIRINRAIFNYDAVLILGPVFPHEVVGFSGGSKYLFPGISGAEIINVTHWLGALATILHTIGIADTPVRQLIEAAAQRVPTPVYSINLVIDPGQVAGLFIGEGLEAWRAAADLSAQRHICWVKRPFQQVLSTAPPMYDELWTAAKAMYKLEPALADGGEIIIYAPHLHTVSHVHGAFIQQAGYHVRDYYLGQWARFAGIPLGVLAHGTHLRGSGSYIDGIEKPRIQVTLASQIPEATCQALNLGYRDPASIRPADWMGREDEGVLYVPKAGEQLYRLLPAAQPSE